MIRGEELCLVCMVREGSILRSFIKKKGEGGKQKEIYY